MLDSPTVPWRLWETLTGVVVAMIGGLVKGIVAFGDMGARLDVIGVKLDNLQLQMDKMERHINRSHKS